MHYKQGLLGEGFSAVYSVISCDHCVYPRRCRNGQCVCEEGLVGLNCDEILCPDNCSYILEHGVCDKAYGRCLCNPGWEGPSCNIK